MNANIMSKHSQTDWQRLAQIPDSDIDLSDIPELDEAFFRNATVRLPKPKKAVSIRLDQDVLDWFKGNGRGYQTRINAVLRTYMDAHPTSGRRRTAAADSAK